MSTTRTCCSVLLAIFLPPLGVFLQFGCGLQLCINILLTILGYVPGIIHALCIIGFGSEDDDRKELPVTHQPAPQGQPAAAAQYTPPYPVAAQPAMGHPAAPPPIQPAGAYPAVPPAGYPPKV